MKCNNMGGLLTYNLEFVIWACFKVLQVLP